MAGDRFDAMCARRNPKTDKTYWVRIGSAFQNEKGIAVFLDALPIPDDEGRVVINLFEPREKDDRPARSQTTRRAPAKRDPDLDDEIPF